MAHARAHIHTHKHTHTYTHNTLELIYFKSEDERIVEGHEDTLQV